jgi:hypothetical protein
MIKITLEVIKNSYTTFFEVYIINIIEHNKLKIATLGQKC